jgi:hypothetical protein
MLGHNEVNGALRFGRQLVLPMFPADVTGMASRPAPGGAR